MATDPDLTDGPPSARLSRALKSLQVNPRTGAMAGVSADVSRSLSTPDLPSTSVGGSGMDSFMSRMREPTFGDRVLNGIEAAAPIFNPRSESGGQAFVGSALQTFAGGQQIQRSRALNSLMLQMQMARAGLEADKTRAQTAQANARAGFFDREAGRDPAAIELSRENAATKLEEAKFAHALELQRNRLKAIAAALPARSAAAADKNTDRKIQQAESRYRPAYQAGVKAVQNIDETGQPIAMGMPKNLSAPHSGPAWEAATGVDARFKGDSTFLANSPGAGGLSAAQPEAATPPRGVGTVLKVPRGAAPAPGSLPGLTAPGAPIQTSLAPVGASQGTAELLGAKEPQLEEEELENLAYGAGIHNLPDDEIRARLGTYHPEDVEEIVRRAAKFRGLAGEDDEEDTGEGQLKGSDTSGSP